MTHELSPRETPAPLLPIYSVEDRRISGEWRTVAEFADPLDARCAAALLRSQGATDVRILLIERPLIP
jgi:hypothetical protein